MKPDERNEKQMKEECAKYCCSSKCCWTKICVEHERNAINLRQRWRNKNSEEKPKQK